MAAQSGVAVLRLLAQGLHEDVAQADRKLRVELRGVRRLLVQDGAQHVHVGGGVERVPPHQQLVEDLGDGEDVRAPVDLAARDLLGRHVRELALHQARARLVQLALGLGHAEVHQLHRALVGHDHVLGRHVAVHDVERRPALIGEGVGVLQALERLAAHAHRQRDRQRLMGGVQARQDVAQVHAAQQLHGEMNSEPSSSPSS
jgi:hypothetical protein